MFINGWYISRFESKTIFMNILKRFHVICVLKITIIRSQKFSIAKKKKKKIQQMNFDTRNYML